MISAVFVDRPRLAIVIAFVITIAGALALMQELSRWLLSSTGMKAVALSPKAGAHGELCGLLCIRSALEARGDARYVQGTDSRLTDARTPTAHASTHAAAGSDPLTVTSAQISDLTETVQDIVGAFLVAGTNVTVTYNDAANTFTINATATGGTTDPEVVRDVIGAAMVAGSGIQITVNDAGDTITIASTAVLPTRQVIAGTGLSGGGDLSADRTLTVAYGTTSTTATVGNDARVTGAAQKASNLSDLTNAATARTNLGLGTAATTASTAYATAAQGALADTALQPSTAQAINAQTGTSYTLVAGDAGKVVTLSNAAAITLNAPGSVFTAGQRVDVVVIGAGMATVVGTSGATANGTPSLVSRAQWSAFTILWTSATACVVIGDLAGNVIAALVERAELVLGGGL